jgi:bifunctional polynucleotide phosphatase/kinase
MNINIEKNENYLVINNITNFNKVNNISMFDLDGTIIKYNGKAKNLDKYELLYPNIIDILSKMSKKNNIIIITNQLQINNNNKYNSFIKKITSLLSEFSNNNIQVEIYVSIKKDKYRKPNIGFMDLINLKYSGKIEYYCGDALGRVNDFNDTDFKFALNLNIKIISPEEVFLKKNIDKKSITYPKLNKLKYDFKYTPEKKDFIILVGFPGSGKSTIANKIVEYGLLNNIIYKVINMDLLKTKEKCISFTNEFIKKKYNIIIDNTNPDVSSRKIFIDIAKKYNYKVKIINIETQYYLALHNNYYRSFNFNKKLIPEIAYRIYKKKYIKPSLNENIDLIINTGINIYDEKYYMYYF